MALRTIVHPRNALLPRVTQVYTIMKLYIFLSVAPLPHISILRNM
jgi:hypothetical protein